MLRLSVLESSRMLYIFFASRYPISSGSRPRSEGCRSRGRDGKAAAILARMPARRFRQSCGTRLRSTSHSWRRAKAMSMGRLRISDGSCIAAAAGRHGGQITGAGETTTRANDEMMDGLRGGLGGRSAHGKLVLYGLGSRSSWLLQPIGLAQITHESGSRTRHAEGGEGPTRQREKRPGEESRARAPVGNGGDKIRRPSSSFS